MKQKLITIAIVLLGILCLSASAVLTLGGSNGIFDNNNSGSEIIKTSADPIKSVGSNSSGEVSLIKIDTADGERTAIVSESIGKATNAYAASNLEKIDLYDYNTYVIEFDVFTPEGYGALLGVIHLSLQDNSTTSNYHFSASTITMKDIDGDDFTLNIGGTAVTNRKDKFHIQYRIDVNKYDMEKSVLNIYIDGVNVYDSSELAEPVFKDAARYLYALKLKSLYSYDGGAVVVSNLQVKGINK